MSGRVADRDSLVITDWQQFFTGWMPFLLPNQKSRSKRQKYNYREHWIQHITFAAETNAACSRGSADTQQ